MASRRTGVARSRPRPGARTGSGARPGGRPAAGGPVAARPPPRRSSTWPARPAPVRLLHRVPQPLIPRGACGPRRRRAGPRPANDHVAGLAGHAEVQPVPGKLLDVGGIVEPLLLPLQRVELRQHHLPLRLQLVDLAELGDVLPHRVGQAQRDRADDYRQHRGPAGEPGSLWWLWPPALQHYCPVGVRGKAAAPAYSAASSSSSSIRSSWLYFATRSDLAGAPALICPQLSATARSAIVVSSVSPDR